MESIIVSAHMRVIVSIAIVLSMVGHTTPVLAHAFTIYEASIGVLNTIDWVFILHANTSTRGTING